MDTSQCFTIDSCRDSNCRWLGEPARRIETIQPSEITTTPSGEVIVDVGENLAGYVRIKKIEGKKDHQTFLGHGEVKNGELLRAVDVLEEYTYSGNH